MRSARAADRLKAVRSDQTFRAGQQQPPRRYLSAGSSPIALTPNFSSLSPLYPLPASPNSVGSASSTTLDDAIGRLFTRYLPTFFDLLEKFQYQKALLILEDEEETQWKSWDAFKVMLKLGASCESTYHLMKYLEAELVQTDTIEQLYGKLVVLMNHLADELKPIVARQSRHFSVHTPTPRDGEGGENEYDSDPMLMMEIAMCGDMSYYVELLEQGAEFFSIYRGLALSTVPRDYQNHIDAVSDYPLFEGNGVDFDAGGDDEGLLLEESDENYGVTSDSIGVTPALPIRRGLVQKPGDPYVSSGGVNSSLPSNTLEQAILGGGGNGTGGSGSLGGNSLGASQGISNGGGVVGGSTNPVAAEMMASSMKKQERDDGFALPVFQWSKRFYRSLVAKFTLYFHRWLEPFEKKTDYLALELSRFIKTPLGISYLQLMDVLLSRDSNRGEGSKIRVMLILETQTLENKGAHYYEHGYRCPSSSNALYTRTDQEKQDERKEQEARQKAIASAGSANASGVSSRTHSPASSRGGGASPANGRRRSVDQANHALFMRVDHSSPPRDHWPNIISLIMDNRSSLDSVRPVFVHAERRLRATYHISRVDEAMYLVLLAEGVKKPNEKVAQHSGAFSRVLTAAATSSA
uniref:Uncharacterized protein n=1 Tax=Phytophthora ramorum TaxID=164328 RepID=H3HCK2_PHYRM